MRRMVTKDGQHTRDVASLRAIARTRRRLGGVLSTSIIAGLVALLVTAAVGAAFTLQRPTEWTAVSTLLLTPEVAGRGTVASSYYDTLSTGQLPSTAAAIVRDPSLLNSTAQDLGIDPDEVTSRVVVVPATSVIEIEVTGSDADTAVAVADGLAAAAAPAVNELLAPYALSPLGDAADTATLTSLSVTQWLAIVALTAVVLGVAVQQTVYQLMRARPRRRE